MTVEQVTDCAAQPVEAALALARGFAANGRLLAAAPGRIDHAQHIAVEFVHPVVAGARSLPALASEQPPARPGVGDMVVVVEQAGEAVAHPVPMVIPAHLAEAEVVRTYHLLWELVHICLEHPGLSGGSASPHGDSTGFLYPFLDADEHDEAGLVDALTESVAAKRSESEEICRTAVAAAVPQLAVLAERIRATTASGNRVLLAGNGGSASDAGRLARLLRAGGHHPVSLAANPAVVSALANDLGAEHVFSRQIQALGTEGDLLVCLTTSGASANLIRAAQVAGERRIVTATIAGYGGGQLGRPGVTDISVCVESQSVHRIQEAQAALIDELISVLSAGERAA